MADISSSLSASLDGIGIGSSSVPAYTNFQAGYANGSNTAYTRGGINIYWIRAFSYLNGAIQVRSNQQAFLTTKTLITTSVKAYVNKPASNIFYRIGSFCQGILRSNIPSYMEGDLMAQVDYIWFKTSDDGATRSKKFRVLQQDYDDGTLEKAEDLKKTIGGGVDHSVGEVYKTWSMIIKVRDEETELDYGDKEDLEYFWGLNNPMGVPSNDITFIDHHQVEYTVHTVGKLTKNLLGTQIQGECAWYLYKMQLIRVQ